MRAKELAISQSDDAGASAQSRRIVATEVGQLFDQSVQIGNRKLGERYIYGGYKTNTPPFDLEGNYHGDRGEMKIHIDKDSFLPMNMRVMSFFKALDYQKMALAFDLKNKRAPFKNSKNKKFRLPSRKSETNRHRLKTSRK